MTMQTWYADTLRAWGLTVHEVDGWKDRTHRPPGRPAPAFDPEGVLVHHTATPATVNGDAPTLNLILRGRADLPGPLYAILVGRSGAVYVCAAGRCNHAGEGGPLDGITSGNRQLIGVALEASGRDPIPLVQARACASVCAALLHHLGQPATRCWGHREWTSRKTDPAPYSMDAHRMAVVDQLLLAQAANHPTQPKETPMAVTQPTLTEIEMFVASDFDAVRNDDEKGQRYWVLTIATADDWRIPVRAMRQQLGLG